MCWQSRLGRCAFLAGWVAVASITSAQVETEPSRIHPSTNQAALFPRELVDFTPHPGNPVFAGTGQDTWDRHIRERGYILHVGDTYHLWYTGYRSASAIRLLGHATSTDGIHWNRDRSNPVYAESWCEDMCVLHHDGQYIMFAEGKHDIAHQLISTDGRRWQSLGSLDVRQKNGSPIVAGPYGTPTVWFENGTWYLFYERRDAGVWLATSSDRITWTNVQDEPVLARGPDRYDRAAVAMNQVIQYRGRYYGYYHATAHEPWQDWTTNVATSEDLVHWVKYPHNPIVSGNKSSGIVIFDGQQWRLYTMHPDVRVYFSNQDRISRPDTATEGRSP